MVQCLPTHTVALSFSPHSVMEWQQRAHLDLPERSYDWLLIRPYFRIWIRTHSQASFSPTNLKWYTNIRFERWQFVSFFWTQIQMGHHWLIKHLALLWSQCRETKSTVLQSTVKFKLGGKASNTWFKDIVDPGGIHPGWDSWMSHKHKLSQCILSAQSIYT